MGCDHDVCRCGSAAKLSRPSYGTASLILNRLQASGKFSGYAALALCYFFTAASILKLVQLHVLPHLCLVNCDVRLFCQASSNTSVGA